MLEGEFLQPAGMVQLLMFSKESVDQAAIHLLPNKELAKHLIESTLAEWIRKMRKVEEKGGEK